MNNVRNNSELNKTTSFAAIGRLFLFLCLFSFVSSSVFAEKIHLDVSASDVRKIAVAVPGFKDKGSGVVTEEGRSLAKLLAKALEFHGFIKIVDLPPNSEQPAQGVDFVVAGEYGMEDGKFLVEAKLQDVVENKMLAGKRFKGDKSQKNEIILSLADAIIKEFTGEPGVSKTSIVYISDENGGKDVYIQDVMGLKKRQVTRHKYLCVSPRVSPDGNFLVYTTFHRGNQDLYITDLRQSKLTRSLSRRKGMNLAPAFSPDGQSMVVTLSKDGNPDLYLMDRKGRIIERLTSGAGINVSADFSPDGKSIVFVSDRSGKPQIYIMNLVNKQTRRLTFSGTENSEPSWSPKGDKIAYTGRTGGKYHIFTIDVSGGEPVQITSGWGDYESPDWSPDGRQLVLSRKRQGKAEICTISANGGVERVLWGGNGNQLSPRWVNKLY